MKLSVQELNSFNPNVSLPFPSAPTTLLFVPWRPILNPLPTPAKMPPPQFHCSGWLFKRHWPNTNSMLLTISSKDDCTGVVWVRWAGSTYARQLPMLWPYGIWNWPWVGLVLNSTVFQRSGTVDRMNVMAPKQSKGRGLLRKTGCGGAQYVLASWSAGDDALMAKVIVEDAKSKRQSKDMTRVV